MSIYPWFLKPINSTYTWCLILWNKLSFGIKYILMCRRTHCLWNDKLWLSYFFCTIVLFLVVKICLFIMWYLWYHSNWLPVTSKINFRESWYIGWSRAKLWLFSLSIWRYGNRKWRATINSFSTIRFLKLRFCQKLKSYYDLKCIPLLLVTRQCPKFIYENICLTMFYTNI